MTDHDQLRARAEAATPGPRYAHMRPTGLRGKASVMREAMTRAAEAEKGRER